MKKVIALILALLMFSAPALAAEWSEGCGPAKPYSRVPEVDLTKTIGYMMYFPTDKMPEDLFCDLLKIYLPREDVEIGKGRVRVNSAKGTTLTVDIQDERFVTLRPMNEEELTGLIWGGGVCFEIRLPISLTLGESYYVNFDEGVIRATGNGIPNSAVKEKDRWVINMSGDYGVSDLYYSVVDGVPGEGKGVRVVEERVPASEANAVTFKVVLGGDAKRAYMYLPNRSIEFDSLWIEETGTVTGL